MSGAPAQSYKINGEGVAGGGETGSRAQNTSSMQGVNAPNLTGGVNDSQTSGPQQEIAGTLPTDFTLSNTKADPKVPLNTIPNPESQFTEASTAGRGGDEIRQPIHAHDVDLPPHAPHQAVQSNETGRPVHSNYAGPPKAGEDP